MSDNIKHDWSQKKYIFYHFSLIKIFFLNILLCNDIMWPLKLLINGNSIFTLCSAVFWQFWSINQFKKNSKQKQDENSKVEIKNRKLIMKRIRFFVQNQKLLILLSRFVIHSNSFFECLNWKRKRSFCFSCIDASWERKKGGKNWRKNFKACKSGWTVGQTIINVIKSNIIELIILCSKKVEYVLSSETNHVQFYSPIKSSEEETFDGFLIYTL